MTEASVKVATWRTPEMHYGYRWYGLFCLGQEVPVGHWMARVEVRPGSTLARYLGEPGPAPGDLGPSLWSALVAATPTRLQPGSPDYHGVEAFGWTRSSAKRRALRRYRKLRQDSRMVEDTHRTDELEIMP